MKTIEVLLQEEAEKLRQTGNIDLVSVEFAPLKLCSSVDSLRNYLYDRAEKLKADIVGVSLSLETGYYFYRTKILPK